MERRITGMRDTQSKENNTCFVMFTELLMCRDPEPFDWYQRYSGIRDLVNQV